MTVYTSRQAKLLCFAALLCLARPSAAQTGAEVWEAHTSYRSVLAVASTGEHVWAATDGGVFSLNSASGEIERYSVIDGLNSVQTRTIEADPERGVIWVGYSSGVLDRIEPESGVITSFRDIARATQFASRGINAITVQGDSLLIATDFGVVVFDPTRTEVRDSYTRLGAFSPAIRSNDVIVAPGEGGQSTIWVATNEGIAWAPLSAPNLQDPSAWVNEFSGFMTSQDDATALAWFDGLLYVGTTTDLFARNAGGNYTRKFVSSAGVNNLAVGADRLYGTERFNMFVVSPGGQAQALNIPAYQNPSGVVLTGASGVWVGDAVGGLLSISIADPTSGAVTVASVVSPDGPTESQFSDLDFGPESVLWAAGANEATGGFHRLGADGAWTPYTGQDAASLAGTGRFTRIAADKSGSGWAGSEGSGVVQVTAEGELVRHTPANSSLEPAPGTQDFVITGGLDADGADNLWVTTRASAKPLHVRDAAGTWTAFDPYIGDGLSVRSTAYGKVFVDAFDQKWIIVRSENNFNEVRGLMVLDTGPILTDQSDDSFRFFDEPGAAGLGLPSQRVSTVVEDRDGLVWIGTETGLAYFVNTGIVARDPSARAIWPQWADRSNGVFVLFGLRIHDLAVDPANRLWVATSEGAWLIEAVEGGFGLVEHFTADNSPLFSDVVLSIAVDPADGRVFFATDQGLVSYQGEAIAPASTADDLFVYPNPVRGQDEVVIEGLVESAQIRIVTPGGSTVAAFSSRGGRVRWNGRDKSGALVPTGVYLVIAVGDDGQGTAYGKVAIVR